ncbi:MAG: small ribosomal subunit biogenesis GTPase RsgA [Cyanobacteria bacterium P01_H01_bin.119]
MERETAAESLVGTVTAVQANYYWVKLSAASDWAGAVLLCTRRARLKKTGQQVMVGDRVVIEEPDWQGQRGAIAAILPRSTTLDRPPVANASQILLVFALADPQPEPLQMSWFLVKAEAAGLRVAVALNKCDLVDPSVQTEWSDRLQTWGYAPLWLSVYQGQIPTDLNLTLQQQTTIVCGPSGVGKSSLINALIPDLSLRVSAVSGKLGRGRHTTRHVELFELPRGGLLADTPGFNQPDIDCGPEALENYFPEIRQRLKQQRCRFSDCLHRDEPGCAVRGSWERYKHYLQLVEDLLCQQAAQLSDTDDTGVKYKVTTAGQRQAEPRLAAKKYRRISRRSRNQALQDLCQEIVDTGDNLEILEGLSLDDLT